LVHDLAFSPDGGTLLVIDDKGASAWDIHRAAKLFDMADGQYLRRRAVFYPDGKRVALFGEDMQDMLWIDPATGKQIARFQESVDRRVTCCFLSVAFSRDGKWMASISPKDIMIWDMTTERSLHTILPNETQLALAFSEDGRTLATSAWSETIKIWDATKGTELKTLRGHSGWIAQLAISADGKWLASGSTDRTVRVWDVEKGQELHTFQGHTTTVDSVAFSPDSKRLASTGRDGTVKIWNPAPAKVLGPLEVEDRESLVCDLALSPNGRWLAVSRVKVNWVGGSRLGDVEIWDRSSGRKAYTLFENKLSLPESGLLRVAFSADGSRLAIAMALPDDSSYGSDADVPAMKTFIYDVETGTLAWTLDGTGGNVLFTPDGRHIITLTNHYSIWTHEPGNVSRLDHIEGGRLEIWDLKSGTHESTIEDEEWSGAAMALSHDGSCLAVFERRNAPLTPPGRISLWTFGDSSLQLRRRLEDIVARQATLALSPDGRWLAVCDLPGSVSVWDIADGTLRSRIQENRHGGYIVRGRSNVLVGYTPGFVAFSPDGRRLAIATDDSSVQVWDSLRGQQLLTFDHLPNSMARVFFADGGRRLVALGPTGKPFVWDAAPIDADKLYGRAAGIRADELMRRFKLKDAARAEAEADPALADELRAAILRRLDSAVEDINDLNTAAWELVVSPDRNSDDYARALRFAQAAAKGDAQPLEALNTLGVAQYRAGRFRDAIESLTKCDERRVKEEGKPDFADLAFLAMAHHQLGQHTEAASVLARLRALVKTTKVDAENSGFVREAEELLGEKQR
jgi:WD40 repeat protein